MCAGRSIVASLVLSVLLGGSAFADQDPFDRLRRELDALRRTVERQSLQIDELCTELDRRPEVAAPDLQAAVDNLVSATEARGVRIPTATKKGARFELYGFVRVDAIYNDSRAGVNNQIIGWALSEDPAAPPGVGAGGDERGDFTVHTRLSRIGVDFDGGTTRLFGGADVTGKIEVDFYEGGKESRSRLRMRKAYMNLEWGEVSLLAGQTTELIAPLYASVNANFAQWGAGNLGDRRPQIRLTYAPTCGVDTWFLQGMVGQTGAIDAANFDGPGTHGAAISDGQKSGRPTLQGRVAYRRPLDAGRFELGLWGHRAWEDPDTSVGTKSSSELVSSGWGFDVQLPVVADLLALHGEWFSGRNLDDVRGGIFQGVNALTGEEIGTTGGFVELRLEATDWMTWSLGYSEDDPDNDDLSLGGRAKNEAWWLATCMRFEPVTVGLEYMDWRTRFVGFGDGDLHRVLLYLAHSF